MTIPFWSEVEEIFTAVIAASESERGEVLHKLCAGRNDLREEVEALVAAHAHASTFMPTGSAESSAGSPAQHIGSQVGSFRIVELIARGGMGDVFRAERSGADFEQQVAIKLIAGRVSGEEALRRFRTERRVLATLQHPNIVALLDGGVTEAGQPYLVMEYVDGVPITEFCRHGAATLEERLDLFRQLCSAVDFAHRHLTIHRDLKPANVLVTPERVVKVLDFGIAKLLDQDGRSPAATAPLLTPMTPNYASPEQLRGDAVTTVADVYALGIILYELVAGKRPYETEGKRVDELIDLVVRYDPRPPSSHARVPRDLDLITMRAMAKDPAVRYASAAQLSEDIERFLKGAPIMAAGTSVMYLLRKTAARHRAAFGVAAISLLLVVGALVMATGAARAAARERERALQRFNDVRELAGALIFKIHDEVAPLAGSTPVRRTLVAEGLKFLKRLERDAGGDPALQLELARAYVRIGNVQGNLAGPNLGRTDDARRSYERAISLANEARAQAPADTEAVSVLIDAHLPLSSLFQEKEKMDTIRSAHALATGWHRKERSPAAAEALARTTFFLALGTPDDKALPLWLDADRVFKELLAAEPRNDERLRNVALTQKYLASFHDRAGDVGRFLQHAQNALALDRDRLKLNSENRSALIDVAIDLGMVGRGAALRGEHDEAIAAYRESLSIRQQIHETDPSDVYALSRVAYGHAALANTYADGGQIAATREHANIAIELFDGLARSGSRYAFDRALAEMAMARAARAEGRHLEACGWFQAARESYLPAEAGLLARYRQLTEPVEAALADCSDRGLAE